MSLQMPTGPAGMPSRRRADVRADRALTCPGSSGEAAVAPAKPCGHRDDPAARLLGHRRGDGLGQMLDELRHRDGQGVARPGGALAQQAAVRGGEHDTGTRAARVEADDELTALDVTTLLVQIIAHH